MIFQTKIKQYISLIEHYNNFIKKKELLYDNNQIKILEQLELLRSYLINNQRKLFSRKYSSSGIYIHGKVGRGKSLLMDLFFKHCDVNKKRIHFHEYMINIHKSLHQLRKTQPTLKDPLKYIAKEFSKKFQLLCFDEFQVVDVADAMILERLFRCLFHYKVVIVTTSNRHPKDLYQGGIQREKYLDFVNYINNNMQILALLGQHDYRKDFISHLNKTYIYPVNAHNNKKIAELFHTVTANTKTYNYKFKNMGRNIIIDKVASSTAMIDFNEFCIKHYTTSDYQIIAQNFNTIFFINIPKLSIEEINYLKRFSNFIDILYEYKCNVIFYAKCKADEIYQNKKHSFEFQRILSRISEMQTSKYIKG